MKAVKEAIKMYAKKTGGRWQRVPGEDQQKRQVSY